MSKGILLVNLGSPDSPEPKDVKKYLGESFSTLLCLNTESQWVELLAYWIDNWASSENPFA